jgi:Lamin Tail Domain
LVEFPPGLLPLKAGQHFKGFLMKFVRYWPAILLLGIFAITACGSDDPVEPVPDRSGLVINEFMAENDTLDVDGTATTPDWIELYNTGTEDVDIRGWFMTDDISEPVSSWYHIPIGPNPLNVPAGGWLVLYANGHPEMGHRYLDFKLSDTGESIGLANVAGAIVSSLVYEQQTADLTMGRFPDGSANLAFLTLPTPGGENTGEYGNLPALVRGVTLDSDPPLPFTDVTLTADIFDDYGLQSVLLNYRVDDGDWVEVTMTQASKITGNYSCVVPGQEHGAVVGYYLVVKDSANVETIWPEGAPQSFASFSPSLRLPYTLYINEIMASNASFDVDGTGEFPDWIEIYNPGETAIDLGGMYITDDLSLPQQWQIPTTGPLSTTIAAGGFLVLFADRQPELGVLHLDFRLSSDGETLGLFADDGEGHILKADTHTFGRATVDASVGRQDDGADTWVTFVVPTPGASNSGP